MQNKTAFVPDKKRPKSLFVLAHKYLKVVTTTENVWFSVDPKRLNLFWLPWLNEKQAVKLFTLSWKKKDLGLFLVVVT